MKIEKNGTNLVITVPIGKGTPSKSGRMLLMAQTGGWIDAGVDDLRINLMVGKRTG